MTGNRIINRLSAGLVGFLVVLVSILQAAAATISYQGRLTDDAGVPLNGSVEMFFAVYDDPDAGTLLWEETQMVTVTGGIFNVALGVVTPFPVDIFDQPDRFLEVTVNDPGGAEVLTPRQPITATAMALVAEKSKGLAAGALTTIMIADGSISSPKVSSGAINSTHIAVGAVSSSQIVDGSVTASDVAFNYAASSTQGGPALDLNCTDCVSSSEVQEPLSLSGASSMPVVNGTNIGSGPGVHGEHGNGNYGYLGGSGAGAYGRAANGNTGWLGSPSYGVYGYSAAGNAGFFAGDVSIYGSGKGLAFPDGTRQTSAVTGGGVPSGFCILGRSPLPPAGYSDSGAYIPAFTGTPDAWTPLTAVPTAAGYPAVAEVKERIYVIGSNGYFPSAAVYEYDPTGDAWSAGTAMPTARYGCGVTVVDDRIYVIGGTDGFATLAANQSYDPAADQWTVHAAMTTPRAHLACAAYDGRIYCFGGTTAGSASAVAEMYNPATDKWFTQAAMPAARSGIGAVAADGAIFVIGGSDANEVYDPVANSWESRAPLMTPRRHLSTVVLNGKIHALGGGHWIQTNCQERCGSLFGCDEDIWVTSDTLEVYDPGVDQWSAKRMAAPRMGAGGVALARKIYLLGGVTFEPDNPLTHYVPSDAADEYASNTEAYYLFVKD